MVSRFRTKAEQKAIARRPRRRQGRRHRRHAPAAVEGRRVPRPRAARRGRGAAVRRGAQGEDQAAAEEGGRADDERDADSAHAEHVARRHPRHVDHRDAAEGPAVDPDQRRQVRPAGDRAARSAPSWRAAARSTSCTTASSRSSRSAACVTRLVPEARVVVAPRADGRGRARARDARLRRAEVRRPARDDHRRERPRHPEREHDHHQPRRSLRPVAALPAARARRPIRPRRRTRTC